MYTVPVSIRESIIEGRGVFAETNIKQGAVVWQFTEGHDKKMTTQEFDALDEPTKTELQRIAYLSPSTNMWVIPPQDDAACYTNHDPYSYNTSVIFDENISDEPIFIANRDIKAGEEITNNYTDFDSNSTPDTFPWLKS